VRPLSPRRVHLLALLDTGSLATAGPRPRSSPSSRVRATSGAAVESMQSRTWPIVRGLARRRVGAAAGAPSGSGVGAAQFGGLGPSLHSAGISTGSACMLARQVPAFIPN
jgi:hypothetical protein